MSETIPESTPPTDDPKAPETAPPPAQEETDWKAMARQWEKRAKENNKAADDLAKLKQQSMSEQEKAVEQAKAEGRAEAAREHGRQLAESKFEAALAKKGIELGDVADLIDVGKFVKDDGTVDQDAITKAVARLAKLAPKAPSTSGGDFGGGNGGGAPSKSLDEQIAEAEKTKNFALAIALKRQRAAQPTT
ncbi:hypothetical protein ACFFV7_50985 [Nonomuraea spiralis]|uniref:Scaffolding protein n=1 Tax=Nonomuraea spiralis TaxID=46182 RepID=A0ABV5IZB4_9ACTN|nr:hypothetical protein [Nonomuraea spiralis]GGS88460.1 hypothetical protein GCM10010176_035290 [Nonomuraea spiralis]